MGKPHCSSEKTHLKGTFTLVPLPKIDELLALLKGAKYFTALDLHSVYCHIKLDEESIPKSAFTTGPDTFESLRLSFGLSQAPDFFICLIYNLFGLDKTSTQGQGFGYFAYLDNILIYSRTEKNTCKCSTKHSNGYSRPDSKLN